MTSYTNPTFLQVLFIFLTSLPTYDCTIFFYFLLKFDAIRGKWHQIIIYNSLRWLFFPLPSSAVRLAKNKLFNSIIIAGDPFLFKFVVLRLSCAASSHFESSKRRDFYSACSRDGNLSPLRCRPPKNSAKKNENRERERERVRFSLKLSGSRFTAC